MTLDDLLHLIAGARPCSDRAWSRAYDEFEEAVAEHLELQRDGKEFSLQFFREQAGLGERR